ncbi:MAG: SufS family cysteine desulfurase [Candidatus Iainarchaeum archaeon]|uniref:Cysteine desulfurase n=1 Tax=Candidatus Iainarchaeum sp. TaxID=3101447 RepID=A0A7T9DK33_9ARCH|nr:MAG: SufS family cysteine desulfurase [Candidatus Diapherotrites archaeon]
MKNIHRDFPILKRKIRGKKLTYLDNAATTQKPLSVLRAMEDYYEHHNANVHRGIHKLSEEATLAFEHAHENVAKFIHAGSMKEIVFTRNCSDSLNTLARMLEPTVKRGDEVIVSQIEHHSNLVPWQQLAKRKNAKLRFLPLDKDSFLLHEEKLERMLSSKTKVLAITHASNVLGTIPSIKRLTKMAHAHGVKVVLDMAQSVGHFPVHVEELDVDFAAFSGHKMYGPTGIGVLYGKEALLQEMEPVSFGGDMVRSVSFEAATWNDLPWKFEYGTPMIAEGVGLSAAVDYLRKLGMHHVEKHEQGLLRYAHEQLHQMRGISLYGPHWKKKVGVVAFNVQNAHPHDVASILDVDGIAIRAGNHCTMPLHELLKIPSSSRASFGVYSTEDDIDALVQGITKVEKIFA